MYNKINFINSIVLMIFLGLSNGYCSVDGSVKFCSINPINNKQILEDTKWDNLECKDSISVDVSIGEIEPASIILRADEIIDNIRIKIEAPQNENGTKLPSDMIDTRIVKVWYQNEGAWKTHVKLSEKRVLTPELLLKNDNLVLLGKNTRNLIKLNSDNKTYFPDDLISGNRIVKNSAFGVQDSNKILPFKLEKNKNKQLWFTLRAPEGSQPGLYKAKIELLSNKIVVASMVMKVNILPFKLDSSKIKYTLYYRGQLSLFDSDLEGYISSDFKSETQLKHEFLNMKEHGISNITVYQLLHNKKFSALDDFAQKQLKKYLSILKSVGMEGKDLYYLGRLIGIPNNKYLTILLNDIDVLLSIKNEYGFDNLYLYGVDEAKNKILSSQNEIWNIVKNKGVKIIAAGGDNHTNLTKGLTDILVYQGKRPHREIVLAHEKGNKVYRYANPQVGVENPYVYRKNYGYDLWKDGFDGVMNYAYQHAMGFAWNDSDHKIYRDHLFTYPTIDGVIDTIAWEGFREAVDDIKYLTTLENILFNRPNDKVAEEAREYLFILKNNPIKDSPEIIRKKIASYITTLVLCNSNCKKLGN